MQGTVLINCTKCNKPFDKEELVYKDALPYCLDCVIDEIENQENIVKEAKKVGNYIE